MAFVNTMVRKNFRHARRLSTSLPVLSTLLRLSMCEKTTRQYDFYCRPACYSHSVPKGRYAVQGFLTVTCFFSLRLNGRCRSLRKKANFVNLT